MGGWIGQFKGAREFHIVERPVNPRTEIGRGAWKGCWAAAGTAG